MPPFPKFVEQGQQQRQSPTHVYFGEAQFAASKQPIFLPPPPKQHSPNQQGKVTYYSEQYKVLPQVQMLPPTPTQMTAEYRGVFKQVQPAPAVTYAAPQPASPPNWQQQKYYTYVQHQQGQSPVQVPVYPQAATHHEALLYQEAAQQNAFEPAADGTGQQMQLLAEETRVSSDEHFELLHRDIRELKQLIEAQDTKEVMAKMDRYLEMFKSISHLYRSLMRNEALQRQVGRTDTALGRTMSQMVSSYNDISSVMSSLSKDTEKLVKDAKRSPGNVANREQISRTVNPQELTTKMEGLMRLIDTLKQSYSPEIMNELMEKKKTPQ